MKFESNWGIRDNISRLYVLALISMILSMIIINLNLSQENDSSITVSQGSFPPPPSNPVY